MNRNQLRVITTFIVSNLNMQSIYKIIWLIILAAITLAVCAKAQSCNSTYKEKDKVIGHQYNSTAKSCVDECSTFVSNASTSILEYLLAI